MKKEIKDSKIIIKISVMWIFVLAIILTSIIAFFKNYIFATNEGQQGTEIEIIPAIEQNENAADILQTMVENNYSNKKLVNEERNIEFNTETIKTDKLPKGEEKVQQEGVVGKEQITALQTYSEGNLVEEEIIETTLKQEPVKEIIYIGTSEFLSKYSVHIGEEMYLIESGDIKKEANDESETVYSIKRYLNVTLQDVLGDWAKVKYNNYEGYIQVSKLTSESVTPKITKKNRIAKLQANLSMDMDISKSSGLTLSDYKTIFGYNVSDKNGIFADNAEVFYNMEQKYKINGIFLASIGIHESAWGTSTIAKEKNNLFGYKAYDRDPEKYAQDFENYEECIETVAEALATNYLSPTGKYYNEPTLEGVNTRYASDEN